MAIRLNTTGSVEYVSLLNSAVISDSTNKPFSVCGWFKRRTDTGGSEHPAGVFPDFSGANTGWGFKVSSADNYQQWKYGGSDYNLRTATLDQWVFLAYSASNEFGGTAWYGTSTTLTEVAGVNVGNGSTTLDSSLIGCYPGGASPFKGDIAHWRVWANRALTQAQFESEMASASVVGTSNIYLAWELVADANDSSGNGRNGSVTGSAYTWVDGPIAAGASAVNPSIILPPNYSAFGSSNVRFV